MKLVLQIILAQVLFQFLVAPVIGFAIYLAVNRSSGESQGAVPKAQQNVDKAYSSQGNI